MARHSERAERIGKQTVRITEERLDQPAVRAGIAGELIGGINERAP
jgi:hypothetical protein